MKKKTNTSTYYKWIELQHKNTSKAQEQKKKFIKDLAELSSM